MLTWYVVCQLTSHDHLYKISLRDSDQEPLYPHLIPEAPAAYSNKQTVGLLREFLNRVYKATGCRRPADAKKCSPSSDIVAFANYSRLFY